MLYSTDLIDLHFFGKVAAYVYTIEFQKRGLPHAHILLILLFGFDLLYLDGEVLPPSDFGIDIQSLLQRSFQERRQLLYDNFVEVKGEFAFPKNMDATSVEEIQAPRRKC